MNKYLNDLQVKINNACKKIAFEQEAIKSEEFMELFNHDYIKDILIKWFLEKYPCYKQEDIKDIYIEKADGDKLTVNIQVIPTLEFVDIDLVVSGGQL